jgi:hypothetical protein
MRYNVPRPIGRLRIARATFDAIAREELPQNIRELIEKLRQAELAKVPLDHEKAPRRKDH